MPLSERQLNAAHRMGQDVCVVAGPGSGKTSVLIERFSWLIREQGIEPHRILAITFTEKAATEIKQRIVRAFSDLPALREQIERAYVSTIHAFCARLLRENAITAGIDPHFEVLDFGPSNSMLRQAADEVLENIYSTQKARAQRFLRSLAVATEQKGFVPDLAQSLMSIYSAIRVAGVPVSHATLYEPPASDTYDRLRALLASLAAEQPRCNTANQRETHGNFERWAKKFAALGRTPTRAHFELLAEYKINKGHLLNGSRTRQAQDELKNLQNDLKKCLLIEYYRPERQLIIEALTAIDENYRARKRSLSGVDFDDLEEFAIKLLESNTQLCESVRHSFDYILMDELQDTNPLQWHLLKLLRRPGRFFGVGDVNQSIFGFRHAEPELFHTFRKELEMRGNSVDELRDNYRSRAGVLDSVNTVFLGPEAGIEPHTLIPAAEYSSKRLPSVEVIGAHAGVTEEAERLEARWVARRIQELMNELEIGGRPARYSDIAILTRTNARTGPLQLALDAFDIPSIVLGGNSFFETRETRDLVLLLSVLVNPRDEIALAGFLRSPFGGLSDEDLMRLTMQGGKSLHRGVEMNPPPFWNTIEELRSVRDSVSPDQLLRRVLDESDYEGQLSSRGRANVEKFLVRLRGRYSRQPAPLSVLLQEIQDSPPEAEAPPDDFGNAVRLMTIHKSKGLEFPIVFLPSLHTGRNSDAPIIGFTRQHGLGVKWRDPATMKGAPDSVHHDNKTLTERRNAEEENRLLYVGMTRAKEHLVLSYAKSDSTRNGWSSLVCRKLQVSLNEPTETPVVTPDGVRVFTTSTAPEPVSGSRAKSSSAAVVYIDPPDSYGQYDSAVPVTAIAAWSQCPRKYFLSRHLGWQDRRVSFTASEDEPEGSETGELTASELGSQVHSILAGNIIQDASAEAVELADRFATSDIGRQALKASRAVREQDFVMAVEDVVLRGQIDLWFEHGRRLTLVDYKTDNLKLPVDPRVLRAYELQLQLYALALDHLAGRPPDKAYLYFLRPNQRVEVNVQPLELSAAREAVRAFRAAQDVVDYPLQQGEHCYRCEFYKGMCPAGRTRSATHKETGGEA